MDGMSQPSDSARHVVVTGANRGLGLEFVRQLLARGDRVTAGCRHPDDADDLHSLGESAGERLTVIELDVARDDSVAAAVDRIDAPIDLLVNNAGIYGGRTQSLADFDSHVAADVYNVNVVGPLRLIQRIEPKLAADARVLNISSGYGSIANGAADWPLHYCPTKAGLNMVTVIVAKQWADTDRCLIAMSPGWVQTDMGGSDADLTPEQSVSGMLQTLAGRTASDSGGYYSLHGHRLPF